MLLNETIRQILGYIILLLLIYLSLTGGKRGLFVFLPPPPSPALPASSELDLR
jgi:hypothetical protein